VPAGKNESDAWGLGQNDADCRHKFVNTFAVNKPAGKKDNGRFICSPIALVHEGDSITIDAHKRLIQLNVSEEELGKRRTQWKQRAPRYTRGLMGKYTKIVSTASKGAVTDLF